MGGRVKIGKQEGRARLLEKKRPKERRQETLVRERADKLSHAVCGSMKRGHTKWRTPWEKYTNRPGEPTTCGLRRSRKVRKNTLLGYQGAESKPGKRKGNILVERCQKSFTIPGLGGQEEPAW